MIPLPNVQPVEKIVRNDGQMLDVHSIFGGR
jgi:hypothetical protein